ncbi:MAG: hypothetical protein V3V61_07330, partial [Gammaproteobacteria bacterium]
GIQGYLKYLQPEYETQEQSDEHQQQKVRLSRLRGDLLELRLARENRQLISAKAVDDAWCDITIRAREILLGMAPGLATKIILLKGVDDITDCIEQEIENVLELLATPDYDDNFSEEEVDELDREINEMLEEDDEDETD